MTEHAHTQSKAKGEVAAPKTAVGYPHLQGELAFWKRETRRLFLSEGHQPPVPPPDSPMLTHDLGPTSVQHFPKHSGMPTEYKALDLEKPTHDGELRCSCSWYLSQATPTLISPSQESCAHRVHPPHLQVRKLRLGGRGVSGKMQGSVAPKLWVSSQDIISVFTSCSLSGS